MVEKKESAYDASSSCTPLVSADYLTDGNEPVVPTANNPTVVEFDGKPSNLTNCPSVEFDVKPQSGEDKENIRFAGIGSAIVGLIVGGPVLSVIFGFGAAYAAERNADVRNKFGDVWANIKRFDQKHNVIKKGVNSIGKSTVWLVEKITGKNTSHDSDTLDSWVAAQPTENNK